MENTRVNKNNYNKHLLVNIMITMFVTISCLVVKFSPLSMQFDTKIKLLGWIGNVILFWGIFVFKKIVGTHINQYSLYFLSYYIFSFGQILLFSFGFEYKEFNLLRIYPEESIILYCVFFCIGTCFLLLGALTAVRKDLKINSNVYTNDENRTLRRSVKIVAWILLLISAPAYLMMLIDNLIISIKYGYSAIYELSRVSSSNSLSNIISSFEMWFIPSLYLLLMEYKQNKVVKNILLLIIVFVICASFFGGGRSTAIAIIVSSVFLMHVEIQKFNKKDKLKIILFGILLLMIIPVVKMYRGVDSKSIDSFFKVLSASMGSNFIVDTIGELGGSMQPWLLVYNLIPGNYSFRLGQSYLAALLAVIPSLLLGGHSFTKYANLSDWLKMAANMDYGPGFSVNAEAYYNFGWLGCVFLFFIGWMYYKFLSNNMLKGKILRYKNVFSAITLYLFVTTARNSVYLTIRKELYVIGLPILLIILVNNTLKKNTYSS
nr:O-antigen polysaccharide polymerase Wzy [uncultured Trichococcus sp.]